VDVFAYFDCYVLDVFVHLDCDVYVDCYVYVDSTSTSTSSSSSTGTLRQQQCQQEQQKETCNSRGSTQQDAQMWQRAAVALDQADSSSSNEA
jgi:hypothetical protein